MPTNFTVVPVKDGTKAKAEAEEDDVDDNNVLKEEDEDATGEIRWLFCLYQLTDKIYTMLINTQGLVINKSTDLYSEHDSLTGTEQFLQKFFNLCLQCGV